jgi:glycosyltransferase involved in cell wall biosynthesis
VGASSRIKLLYLRDTTFVCGPGKTIINTARTLNPDRFDLTIASTRLANDKVNGLLERAREVRAQTLPFDIGGGVDLKGAWRLAKLLREGSFDILQTHDSQTRRMGIIAARLAGVKHVTSVHGWIFNNRKERAARWVDQQLISLADHVIAISDRLKQDVIDGGTPPHRITVLKNAILLDDYASEGPGPALRRELGIPAHHAVLSIIGRLSREKGHNDFFDAARALAVQFPDLTFLVVGDGPLRAQLEADVAESSLRGRVVFAGHRSDMAAVYDATTVVVSSSFTEGIPNVLLEGFAHARPAVATRVGGVPEIMSNGIEGWLVEAHRPHELSERLALMLKDPVEREAMGRRARRAIESKFDFRARTRELERVYDHVMSHGHRA